MIQQNTRNIAIVAHVDHGKTTLVDSMLWQSGTFRDNQEVAERVMDSMDLEREKGITIMAKNTAIRYEDYKINIVDTPGHADFGGEVERTLRMVDGILLLVDAAEGPLPQTRFVLQKALQLKLPTILVINKIDRSDARAMEVLNEVYDLYLDLDANEEQIEFPVIFAVARDGQCTTDIETELTDLRPLFESIINHIPSPVGSEDASLQVLITNVVPNVFLGPLAIGRVVQGKLNARQRVTICHRDDRRTQVTTSGLFEYEGLKHVAAEQSGPGAIIAVAGLSGIGLGDSLAAAENPEPLPPLHIDDPTLSMEFRINDSPFAGKDGKYVTSQRLRERLKKETEANLAIRVEETGSADTFIVFGRGELQMAIIIESMRREGYELCVGQPQVLLKTINGSKHEPYETVLIDAEEVYSGVIIQKMALRKGQLTKMVNHGMGRIRLEFEIPSRGLIGYRTEFMTDTKGTGLLNQIFLGYKPWAGSIVHRSTGALVSDRAGKTTGYAIMSMQERGELFVEPAEEVYIGMIVGENSRDNDLDVNITKEKKLTNMRASGSDSYEKIIPPKKFSLEEAIEFIREDELIEITPRFMRLRKRWLDVNDRKKYASKKED